MMTSPNLKIAISSDFLTAFSKIPAKQQKKVREFVDDFRVNPTAPRFNYEKIGNVKDTNLRSVRIDYEYRGIVLKPESGNVYVLLWVDHHDEAYEWAKNRVFPINPEIGSLQVVPLQPEDREKPAPTTASPKAGLFTTYRDRELLKLGVPEILLPLVRSFMSDNELEEAEEYLPHEAFEGLVYLAAGFSLQETLQELEKLALPEQVDTEDFQTALDNVHSQRSFYVVDDARELAEILNSPLEHWRVFLHPSQKRVVEMNANGPVRVLGGAGTGKTVVALHRAKWLTSRLEAGSEGRILFTTFTKNLAADIQQNLEKICSPDLLAKIEVVNIDAWVWNFLAKQGYSFRIAYDDELQPLWENALNLAPDELGLPATFYQDEWKHVIQAQAIPSIDQYLKAARLGRGRKLGRIERKKIWPVFEEYRAQLSEHNLKEFVDAVRDARIILEKSGNILPYAHIIIDEGQDMNAEVFRLIRQMIPAVEQNVPNDVFIVGDAHQRIYEHKVVLSHCGMNIRGRSRKLRINYRTTEETRNWAVRLLENREFDDLDGGVDNQLGYRSLLHGIPPTVKNFQGFQEELDFLVGHIKQLRVDGEDSKNVCLVARTRDILMQYEGALKAAGVQTSRIRRNTAEDRAIPGVRIATMHRVKGLEFDHVIIASVNDGVVPLSYAVSGRGDSVVMEESEIRERALLYVAATRAKKDVMITSYGKRSRFLPHSS